MAFDRIIGQRKAKDVLVRILRSDRIAHAFLFVGARGVGKEAAAFEFARALVCEGESKDGPCGECPPCVNAAQFNSPQVEYLYPGKRAQDDEGAQRVNVLTDKEHQQLIERKKSNLYGRWNPRPNPAITIGNIRDLRRSAALKEAGGKRRVVIIPDVDRMTQDASNAFLKLLEEPPPAVSFVLTSSRQHTLLKTVTSRCQAVKFGALSPDEIQQALVSREGADPARARLAAHMAGMDYGIALSLLEIDLESREQETLQMIRRVFAGKNYGLDMLEVVDQLTPSGSTQQRRDARNEVREVLRLFQLWFRDAWLVRELADHPEDLERRVAFQHQIENMTKFNGHFPLADYDAVNSEIEKSIDLLDRNVYINGLILVLLNRLQGYVRRN